MLAQECKVFNIILSELSRNQRTLITRGSQRSVREDVVVSKVRYLKWDSPHLAKKACYEGNEL